MPLLTDDYVENLFRRFGHRHQLRHDLERVRARLLKITRDSVFAALREGIFVQEASGSCWLVTWRGKQARYRGFAIYGARDRSL